MNGHAARQGISRVLQLHGCGTLGWRPTARAAVLAVLALGAIAQQTWAATGGPIEQATLEIAAVRDPQLGAQVAIADTLGYFKDEGLNVTVRWTQSGADIITFMAGGNQNIGTGGTFTEVVLKAQNFPILTIAQLADISGTQGIALSPGIKLGNPKELEGKRLAFTQGNSQVIILAKMAKQFGFDQGKVTLVNLNPSEGVVAASKGDVDGLMGWQPNLHRLVKLGGAMYATGRISYVTGSAEVLSTERRFQFNNAVLLASEAWIKDKPNTLKAVLRALNRATDLINRDRNAALRVLEKEIRVDRDALEVMVNANVYSLALNDDVATSIKDMSDWALGIKRIPRAVTPDEGIHTKLLEEVDPKLVSWRPKR